MTCLLAPMPLSALPSSMTAMSLLLLAKQPLPACCFTQTSTSAVQPLSQTLTCSKNPGLSLDCQELNHATPAASTAQQSGLRTGDDLAEFSQHRMRQLSCASQVSQANYMSASLQAGKHGAVTHSVPEPASASAPGIHMSHA